MKTQNTKDFLGRERGQTNDSLTSERGKTDASLQDLKKKTEAETDEKIRVDRLKADKARSSGRASSDDDLNGKSGIEDKGADPGLASDERLNEERQANDESIDAERQRVDQALRVERKINGASANDMLKRERDQTDENLYQERKQTDSEVQRTTVLLSEELASHSKTKGDLTTREEFLAIVSHDLRNPIGAIQSCTEMLLDDPSYAGMGKESKYWVEFIKRNSETALRLIHDILEMERVAEGKIQLNLARQNVGNIIRESIDTFIHAASAKRILLRALPPKILGMVVCDHDRIVQVLSNLIGNAIKFTPEGGAVTLRVQEKDASLEVLISDTGPGVSEAHAKRIFERYTQLANKNRQGLGLGLYISRMLVEAHGGNLSVTSTLGKGCVFGFTLPKQMSS